VNDLETKEHEDAKQVGSVWTIFIHTEVHRFHFQYFFRMFQKRHETFSAASGQPTSRNIHVKSIEVLSSLPWQYHVLPIFQIEIKQLDIVVIVDNCVRWCIIAVVVVVVAGIADVVAMWTQSRIQIKILIAHLENVL